MKAKGEIDSTQITTGLLQKNITFYRGNEINFGSDTMDFSIEYMKNSV